ncbi:hypothetical protein BHM03_00054111 [Ensete ventricosum]|nr:hypothetical protein BHM03_00054111 [Ensete ventricosum]
MATVKVEVQRGAKNAALILSVKTLQDSKLRLTSVGDRPSLELYRGSSLLGSQPQWLKRLIYYLMKKMVYMLIYRVNKETP